MCAAPDHAEAFSEHKPGAAGVLFRTIRCLVHRESAAMTDIRAINAPVVLPGINTSAEGRTHYQSVHVKWYSEVLQHGERFRLHHPG